MAIGCKVILGLVSFGLLVIAVGILSAAARLVARPAGRFCRAWECLRRRRERQRLTRECRWRRERLPGWIVPLLERLFRNWRELTAGYWIPNLGVRVWGGCVGADCGGTAYKDPHKDGYDKWVEWYVVLGAALTLGVLVALTYCGAARESKWFFIPIAVFAGYRLTEIFGAAWNVHAFDELRADRPIASAARQLVLNLVNYGEMVALFAILWTVIGTGAERCLNSTWEALEQSLRIATMMGPLGPIGAPVDRVLFVSETVMALMFILFVLVRAVSLIPRRQ